MLTVLLSVLAVAVDAGTSVGAAVRAAVDAAAASGTRVTALDVQLGSGVHGACEENELGFLDDYMPIGTALQVNVSGEAAAAELNCTADAPFLTLNPSRVLNVDLRVSHLAKYGGAGLVRARAIAALHVSSVRVQDVQQDAVVLAQDVGAVSLRSALFLNNRDGVLDVIRAQTVLVRDTVATGNGAGAVLGGVVRIDGALSLTMVDVQMVDNTAAVSGGAIWLTDVGDMIYRNCVAILGETDVSAPRHVHAFALPSLAALGATSVTAQNNSVQCPPGHTLIISRTYGWTCAPCSPGTYSLRAGTLGEPDVECKPCPRFARCAGGAGLSPERGFAIHAPSTVANVTLVRMPQPYVLHFCEDGSQRCCTGGRDGVFCTACVDGLARTMEQRCEPEDECTPVYAFVLANLLLAVAMGTISSAVNLRLPILGLQVVPILFAGLATRSVAVRAGFFFTNWAWLGPGLSPVWTRYCGVGSAADNVAFQAVGPALHLLVGLAFLALHTMAKYSAPTSLVARMAPRRLYVLDWPLIAHLPLLSVAVRLLACSSSQLLIADSAVECTGGNVAVAYAFAILLVVGPPVAWLVIVIFFDRATVPQLVFACVVPVLVLAHETSWLYNDSVRMTFVTAVLTIVYKAMHGPWLLRIAVPVAFAVALTGDVHARTLVPIDEPWTVTTSFYYFALPALVLLWFLAYEEIARKRLVAAEHAHELDSNASQDGSDLDSVRDDPIKVVAIGP